MLDDARHGDPGCAAGSHKRVINIDVNDHNDGADDLGEGPGSVTPRQRCAKNKRVAIAGFIASGLLGCDLTTVCLC